MMRTSTGNISVTKIAQKHTRRSGKRKNTTAYAEGSEIAILPAAMTSAITRLFHSIAVTGWPLVLAVPALSDSAKLAMRREPGTSVIGAARMSGNAWLDATRAT